METARREAQAVEEFKSTPEELMRLLSQRVRDLQAGMGTNHFNVTLEADATETTIFVSYASVLSQVQFSPASPAAATAIAAGTLWYEASEGQVVIHHDSLPESEERKLGVILHG